MEESINPSPVPSNCTSSVCSDPAHDDLALDAEWSDENRDCDGDGPHRVVEDPEDLDVPDVQVRGDEDRGVQQVLLRFSGAHAPEILKVTYTYIHTTDSTTGNQLQESRHRRVLMIMIPTRIAYICTHAIVYFTD